MFLAPLPFPPKKVDSLKNLLYYATKLLLSICQWATLRERQQLIRQLGKLSWQYVQQLNEALIYTLKLDEPIGEVE